MVYTRAKPVPARIQEPYVGLIVTLGTINFSHNRGNVKNLLTFGRRFLRQHQRQSSSRQINICVWLLLFNPFVWINFKFSLPAVVAAATAPLCILVLITLASEIEFTY